MKRRWILTVGLWLVPTLAWANPMAGEVVKARQVPNTHLVQVTYGVDDQFTAGTPSVTAISRDGASLGLSWHGLGGFTANTGSGLVGLNATQACDCDVPVGQHEYVVRVKSAMGGKEMDYKIKIEVLQDLQAPADAGVPGGDMLPWDIPEPGEIQGLDCRLACTGVASDGPMTVKDAGSVSPDTTTQPRDAGSASPDATQPKDEDDEGGCSLGRAGQPLSLSLLLLLGLGLMLRRRR